MPSFHALFAAEHAPTDTIVRRSGNTLEVFRAGELAARLPSGDFPGASRDGRWLYADETGLVDLAAPAIAMRRLVLNPDLLEGPALHPDGDALIDHVTLEDPMEGRHPDRKVKGIVRTTWDAVVDEAALPKDLDRSGRRVALLPKASRLAYPRLDLAPDGATWALTDGDALELGRDGERLARARLKPALHEPRPMFDLPRGRVVVAGHGGVQAFTLGGEPVARLERDLASPVARWGERYVAVVHDFARGCVAVHALDPETLGDLGPLPGLPRRRDVDAAVLLPLADGSLAWVPRDQRIWVLPAPGVGRRSGPAIWVVGDGPPPTTVQAPAARWYDAAIGESGEVEGDLKRLGAGQRRSLARFLLDTLADDHRFDQLLDVDPAAFAPYADQVLAFGDADVRRLIEMDRDRYWQVAGGASDAAVDRLAAQVREAIAEAGEDDGLDEVARARVALLAGADTERALAHLGSLARLHGDVGEVCAERCLDTELPGPALRRFHPHALELVAYERRADGPATAGLASHQAEAAALARGGGWTCPAPLIVGLSVDLATRFAATPLAASPLASHHWLYTSCDECDEWGVAYAYRVAPGEARRVELLGMLDVLPVPTRPRKQPLKARRPPQKDCEGSPAELYTHRQLRAEPFDPDRPYGKGEAAGRLGGRPRWTQEPAVPYCPQCGRMGFFVGQLNACRASGATDTDYYGFHCERCGIGLQVNQCT